MPKIALIEYFTTESKTFIFVVRPGDDEPIVYEKDLGEQELENLRYKLLGKENTQSGDLSLNNYNKRFMTEGRKKTAIDYFHAYAELLVDPFLEDVKDYDILYLVPHGWLHYLPLHAMKCGDGEYLMEKHKIVYSPSATVIKYCQAKNSARQEGGSQNKRNCMALGVGRDNDKGWLHKLFNNEAEFVVEDIFKGEGVYKLATEASKKFFMENCSDKTVIHTACHGHFDPHQPLKSGLLLSNGSKCPIVKHCGEDIPVIDEDKLLTAEEIFNLDIHADLVTLGACVTGVNKKKPGDELIGLTRAFIYAGTPSLIVSLWPVHSESAKTLMESFYTYWMDPGKGLSKVEAFQKAQLDMLNTVRGDQEEDWREPFFWAPFILVGDWL
ncbi:MAG: CHAT domain-containing protein [bacterium]|nr:CHAT domain-containing protein [bacterium]